MAGLGITSKCTRFTGAEFIVHFLEHQGIQVVTGIPGGSIPSVCDTLSQNAQIRHVLTRHKQGAGFIAQRMVRTDSKSAVCMARSGPGATNLVTAIVGAHLDSIPLVCITRQVPVSTIDIDAFQKVNTYGASVPVAKHSYLVRHINELSQVMSDALRIMQSGRPGPVRVDTPKDIQTAVFDIEKMPEPTQKMAAPAFSQDSVRDAATMINATQRPVPYFGGGMINAPGYVHELVERAMPPTTMTLMTLGILPKTHPLSLGILSMHSVRSIGSILQKTDLLITLDACFSDRTIGKTEQFYPNAKIIHVDIDCAELGKIKQPCVAVQASVDEVLAQLIPLIDAQPQGSRHQMVVDLQHESPRTTLQENNPLSHYGLINAVAVCVDGSATIATDVGQRQTRAAQTYPSNRPRQWLTSGGLGIMGFGLPAVIGVAPANPDKKVLCFSGDGSLIMDIQEMAAASENQPDIRIIPMNNEVLGFVYQQQSLFYKQGISAATYPETISFMQVAAGFGPETYDLNDEAGPQAALQGIINRLGLALIHVRIGTEQKVCPMVPPGVASTGTVGE